ncbi:MAG: restriction endonuclease subunit M [bacterium]
MSIELEKQQKSTFDENIQRGINAKILSINEDNTKVTYHVKNEKTYKLTDPEEKVRASYFVELVLDYQYSTDKIALEVTVPRRTPSDSADIVIYDQDDKDFKKPYLVVECKKDGITDAEFKQAIEQAFGNANSLKAKLAIVVAGNTRTAFDVDGFESMEREKNVIPDIPEKYGKVPEYKFFKGGKQDLKTVSREELIKVLEKCHDTVWQGGRLAPTVAFDEVSKLLFCKLKDEKDSDDKEDGFAYLFQVGKHETAQDVYKRIDGIYQKAKQDDKEVFQGNLNLDPKILYNVVEHLQGINFVDTDLDTKGVAFERFMQDFFKGKMGQFFTPRQLVEFVVKMLDIKKEDKVLDPASGSGGFLLNALDFVREKSKGIKDRVKAHRYWHDFAKDNLYGIEINDQIARVCKMSMIIHDDGHTNIISRSSLDNFEDIEKQKAGFQKDNFDVIITNPPFGATIKSTEYKQEYLDKFKLGKDKKNQKTEILFIERCIDFVKPETGRIGIVLPDGILTNSSLQYVRDFIMEHCQILAVVSLPQFAFSHYGAGVKSSLVFLRRKGENEKLKKYPIFMAMAEHIGYDATGREDSTNDLETIYEEYQKFKANSNSYEGC